MKTLLLLPIGLAIFAFPAPDAVATPPRGEHDWVVDPVHSSVAFRVKHANIAFFKGTFDVINGRITLDPAKPEAGSVELTIPVDSVDTNDKKRDDHLKAPDFFNAKENPEITFRSTKIEKKGDALEVTGDLAMNGKKKSTVIQVAKTGEGEFMGKRVGYEAKFTIKRSDFGVDYGVAEKTLADEVTLMIDLELAQPKK